MPRAIDCARFPLTPMASRRSSGVAVCSVCTCCGVGSPASCCVLCSNCCGCTAAACAAVGRFGCCTCWLCPAICAAAAAAFPLCRACPLSGCCALCVPAFACCSPCWMAVCSSCSTCFCICGSVGVVGRSAAVGSWPVLPPPGSMTFGVCMALDAAVYPLTYARIASSIRSSVSFRLSTAFCWPAM